jgi:hypothetical protein
VPLLDRVGLEIPLHILIIVTGARICLDRGSMCWVCVIFFARVVVSERLHREHRGVRGGGFRGFEGSAPEIFFRTKTTYFGTT